jgi:hypothetical protein
MSSLNVSPDLAMILADASVKVSFEIGPGGILAEIRDAQSGATIGGLDDLAHFQGVRSFVTQERKELSSEDGLDEQAAMILYLIDEIQNEDSDWSPPADIPSDFHVYLKNTARQCHVLQRNLEIIQGLKTEETSQKESLEVLTKMVENIVAVEMQLLKVFLKEGKLDKGAKNVLLSEKGVPKWFVNKLEGSILVVDKDANINRILYPPAHRSWLTLTLDEWRNTEIHKNLRPISQYVSWLTAILGSDAFLRQFCMLGADINLGDRTVPLVAKLFEGKVSWIPHIVGIQFLLEPISKNKDQGFWPYPRFNNPAETIQSLSQAIGRLLTTMINSSDVLSTFWAKIFPSVYFDRSKISRGNNIQKIALDQYSKQLDTVFETLFGFDTDEGKKALINLVCAELQANKDSSQFKALNHYALHKEDAVTFSSQGKDFIHPTKWCGPKRISLIERTFNQLFDTASSREQIGKIRDLRIRFGNKKPKLKTIGVTSRSVLSNKAKIFISRDLKALKNDSLREKMREWFTAFSSERMQIASVKMLRAHFDELFNRELIYAESTIDSEDAISDSEDGN